MNIRTVESKDLEQLTLLFDGYRIFYRKLADLAAARQFLSERLEKGDSEIYVSETEEGVLVGFVQLYPLFSSTRMKRLWLLNDLFVDPSFRGKGISIALIERAKQLVKDTDACGMYLETEKSNVIGNRLYPKVGFKLNEAANFYEWSIPDA
ncbi:MAG: GNAT family N-acetyltransferase [Bacteroidota bacterium]